MNKINTDHNNRLIIYFFTTNLLFQMGGKSPAFYPLSIGKNRIPFILKERGYPSKHDSRTKLCNFTLPTDSSESLDTTYRRMSYPV